MLIGNWLEEQNAGEAKAKQPFVGILTSRATYTPEVKCFQRLLPASQTPEYIGKYWTKLKRIEGHGAGLDSGIMLYRNSE